MSPDPGFDAPPVPDLVEQLNDADWSSRLQAALALSSRACGDPDVVPALAGALRDAGLPARKTAALVLGFIGPQARAAVPALVAALRDDDPGVRRRAAGALGRIRAAGAALTLLRGAWEADVGGGGLPGTDPEEAAPATRRLGAL
jgi:HEAT repeat protein